MFFKMGKPNNVSIVNDGYYDVALFPNEREPERGDFIYIVTVNYDTGDSFNIEHGCETTLWAFSDKTLAFKLKDALDEDAKNEDSYGFDFEGTRQSCYQWKGYFEFYNFSEVSIHFISA